MRIPSPDPSGINPPPRGVVRKFLQIAKPGRISLDSISKTIGSENDAKVFVTQAVEHSLLIRLDRAIYAAPAPDLCFLSWTLPPYFRSLIAMSSALTRAGIAHGFACLTALGAGANYIPTFPLVAVTRKQAAACPTVQAFHLSNLTMRPFALETPNSSLHLNAPSLDRVSAAMVLAAAGLPREMAAARWLMKDTKPSRARAAEFNALGLRLIRDFLEVSSPAIEIPLRLDRERRRFGEQARVRLLAGGNDGA